MEAVSVTLYIREIIMESLRIEYEERSVQVTFRTKYKSASTFF